MQLLQHRLPRLVRSVGDRQDGHRVTEAIAKIAGVFRRARSAIFTGFERLKPSRIADVDRRSGKGQPRIAVLVNAIVNDGREVLIASDVKGEGLANLAESG